MLNFFTRSLIKRQLKGKVPEAEVDVLLAQIEKNPEFFTTMMDAVQAKVQQGMSQEDAARAVMTERGEDAKKVFGK